MHNRASLALISFFLLCLSGSYTQLLAMEVPGNGQNNTAQASPKSPNPEKPKEAVSFQKEGDICVICREPFNDSLSLACRHTYCKSCLEDTYKANLIEDFNFSPSCPLCRAPLNGPDLEKLDLSITPGYIRSCAIKKFLSKHITYERLETINTLLAARLQSEDSITLIAEAFGVSQEQAAQLAKAIIQQILPLTIDKLLLGETGTRLAHILFPDVSEKQAWECLQHIMTQSEPGLSLFLGTLPVLLSEEPQVILNLINQVILEKFQAHGLFGETTIGQNPLTMQIPRIGLVMLKIALPALVDYVNTAFPLLDKDTKLWIMAVARQCLNMPVHKPKLLLPLIDRVFPLELNEAELHNTAAATLDFICSDLVSYSAGKIRLRSQAIKMLANIISYNPQIMNKLKALKKEMLTLERSHIDRELNELRGYNPFYLKLAIAAVSVPLVYFALKHFTK